MEKDLWFVFVAWRATKAILPDGVVEELATTKVTLPATEASSVLVLVSR